MAVLLIKKIQYLNNVWDMCKFFNYIYFNKMHDFKEKHPPPMTDTEKRKKYLQETHICVWVTELQYTCHLWQRPNHKFSVRPKTKHEISYTIFVRQTIPDVATFWLWQHKEFFRELGHVFTYQINLDKRKI